MQGRGHDFHGECLSADASGGVEFKLYQAGLLAEHTLGPRQTVVITHYSVVGAEAAEVHITAGGASKDEAGRQIAAGDIGANGGMIASLLVPHQCPMGVIPKLWGTAAKALTAIIHGYFLEG
jgi:hypothetical protein